MTAATRPHLLSLEEWRAVGEDTASHVELQEGVLIVSPKAILAHQRALSRLLVQLAAQLPDDVCVTAEPDVVIDPETPATVRQPDLVVERGRETRLLAARDVVIIVEILSPGTRRTDLVMKRHEYAEAGIPHYWIIDLEGPSLEALTLSDSSYGGPVVSGAFTTTEPFELHVDIAHLI